MATVSDPVPSAESQASALERAVVPSPPPEWRVWALAACVAAVGLGALVAVLTGAVGRRGETAPPPLPPAAATPAPAPLTAAGPAGSVRASGGAIVARPTPAQQRAAARRLASSRVAETKGQGAPQVHIARRWMEGFYPIYSTAQATFGVNWLLLASIHMQESAFSTAPGTYEGLNFAGCCGGPMQFNVTNGGPPGDSPSTWDLVSDSYLYGRRPAAYDHRTARHPSIYDDFDSVMAGAHLLSADGAGDALDAAAWSAAYDYYGHDVTGVLYADRVLARAIGWSQRGFCVNCGVPQRLVAAVHAAYGVPVQAALEAPPRAPARVRRTAPAKALAPAGRRAVPKASKGKARSHRG
ncbi:MAG TPA: hypothetical protein VIB59_03770 [Solirubrobacteraceae bacterium]